MDKMRFFCDHARAMLACYVDMTPDQQTLARLYTTKKLAALGLMRTAADAPGGEQAGELLTKLKQLN